MTASEGEATAAVRRRDELLLAGCFLCTGAGLVAHILFDLPIAVGLVLVLLVVATLWFGLGRGDQARPWDQVRRPVAVGVVAGVAATVVYDVTRVGLVTVTDAGVWPFEAFRHFGAGIVGAHRLVAWHATIGALFHAANGVGFAVAYVVAVGRRSVGWAVVWALLLEAATLTLYPRWLGVDPYGEFLQMSVVGHVAYGVTLGVVSRALLVHTAQCRDAKVGEARATRK